MTTLSDYNNNPGNLRPPKGITYDGQIGVDDKGFAIFENKEFGQKALVNDLSYKLRHGVNTPDKFVDKYAPAGKENDEESRENYKLYLASQFGLKSTTDPFPEDGAEKLATAVGAFEGGTWNKPPEEKKEEAAADATVAAQADKGDRLPPGRNADIPGEAEQTRDALGVIGGIAGTGTTAAIETTKKLAPLVPNLINTMTGQGVNPAKPVTRASLQRYLNSQLAENLKLPLSELEKVTGGQKIRTMSEVQTALKALQEVKPERVGKPVSVDPTTGMQRKIYSTTPGRPAVDLSRYETKPAGPVRQALRRELQTAGDVVKSVLPSVGRVGVGGLSAANAMMQGYDAWEMAQKLKAMNDPSWVDYARLATKTMATVGGGLSMLPFGYTQAIGLGLQAPEMGIEAYEYFKNRPQGGLPADETMTVDAMGNPVQ
jgi:hypothetical protein